MPAALDRLHRRHRQLARELAAIGPVLKGSIVERFTPCGNPNCSCNADPPQLHGPYWQWSTAVNGKTVTRRVDADDVPLYLEWIENRKQVEAVLAQMHEFCARGRRPKALQGREEGPGAVTFSGASS
jgi:hypothetical protein